MHVDRLALRNFKCFERLDVDFSKITIFTGPNSSGKSSVLYGLLGPFQSRDFPFYLSPNGTYVNMGDYKEMVFRNAISKPIGIAVAFGEKKRSPSLEFASQWTRDRVTKMPRLNKLDIKAKMLICTIGSTTDKNYIVKLKYDPRPHFKGKEAQKVLKNLESITAGLKSKGTSKDEPLGRLLRGLLLAQTARRRKFSSVKAILREFPIIQHGPDYERFVKKSVNFVSSFRLRPERTYYQTAPAEVKVGKYGENYIDQILEWENQQASEFKDLRQVLRELGLAYSLKSKQLRGGRFELRVKVRSRGVWAVLADVGFGISQFLPLIVADLQLPEESTLFLAQPEIHLHPSAQASLADYFVNQLIQKEKRYVIETHSEYLLNRMRLAIVQSRIKASDVAVYYFDNSRYPLQAHRIAFTKSGKIEGAPKSFFETYMMDAMDIALSAK